MTFTYSYLYISITTVGDFGIDKVSPKKFDRFSETAAVRIDGLKYYSNTL